ncbi:MAG TPA: T9SS type A sorting domain-containing protein, partial [Rubricoccaceae bacterium]
GLRINPENVLFPGETPSGPDDPRLPFGELRPFRAVGAQHFSLARTYTAVAQALRTSSSAALTDYVAAVDAADPGAVATAFNTGRVSGRTYFTVPRDVLGELLDELDATVATPAGLAEAAGDAFGEAFEQASDALYAQVEAAHVEARTGAPAPVRDLFDAEVAALFPEGFPGSGNRLAGGAARRASPIEDLMCSLGFGESINSIQTIGDGSAASGGGGGGGCGGGEGSADPNDKLAETNLTCEFGTVVVDGEEQTRCVRYFVPRAAADDPLIYSITFENVAAATAPAEFVTITDEIDPSLNLASLEVLGTSSDSTFSYSVSGRTVTFRFVGINLPPNVTAPEGEGYVRFSLRPTAGLPDGTEIRNDASIVFDFNPAIATPEVVHQVRETADVATVVTAPDAVEEGGPLAFSVDVANLRGDPAANVTVTISTGTPVASATPTAGTCTGSGPVTCTFESIEAGAFETVAVELAPLPLGTYTVTSAASTSVFDGFTANDADAVSVSVVGVGVEDGPAVPREVTLSAPWPNPARGEVTLRWGLPQAGPVDVRVYDLLGREVARLADGEPGEAGWHESEWDARSLASGVYIVRLQVGGEARTRRVTVLR